VSRRCKKDYVAPITRGRSAATAFHSAAKWEYFLDDAEPIAQVTLDATNAQGDIEALSNDIKDIYEIIAEPQKSKRAAMRFNN
jgi:hypothetical protein